MQEIKLIPLALKTAYAYEMFAECIQAILACSEVLETRGMYEEVERHLPRALQATQEDGDKAMKHKRYASSP